MKNHEVPLCSELPALQWRNLANIADFVTELYCQIDDALPDVPQHSPAILSLSELITIGVLQAMKQVTQRAFYHWLKDNYAHLFFKLPSHTRLNRRLRAQRDWTGYFGNEYWESFISSFTFFPIYATEMYLIPAP